MIVEQLFRIIVELVVFLDSTVLPALPEAFDTVWNTMLSYLGVGFQFIGVTFDIGFIRTLIGFWITFGATVLAIEVTYGIWKKITGNAGREATSETTTFNTAGEVVQTRVSRSSSRPKLPH